MSYLAKNKETIDIPLHTGRDRAAIIIAKIYLFCLTFKMVLPLRFLQSVVGSAAYSFTLLPHIIGFLLVLVQNNGKMVFDDNDEGSILIYFARMVIWFIISSIIMAFVMQQIFGNQGNENAFDAIKGMILYYIQYLFILYYNYYVFKALSLSEISRVLQAEINVLLVIGYIQIAVMLIGGPVASLYDRLNFLSVLNKSSSLPKLSLTADEGAHAGYVMGALVFPYLFASHLANRKRLSFAIQLILWIPVLYFTYSTAAYVLFVICAVLFIFYKLKAKGLGRGILFLVALLMILVLVFLIVGDALIRLLPDKVSSNIRYILFEKITDENNGSSVSRRIGLYYNWGAFTEFPIIGVGNGCQGYFLKKYIPDSMFSVPGFDARKWLISNTKGISNGSLFWPSVLSGYGVVGAILFIVYIYKNTKLIYQKKEQVDYLYYMYVLGLICIIIAGFATDFVSKYYFWFVLSIPLYTTKKSEESLNKEIKQNKHDYLYIKSGW